MTYEAYGLGGVGLVMEILTDNLNRAAMSVRSAVTKSGGKMADPGSVLFNFERRGFCVLTGGGEDEVFEAAMDAGAADVRPRPGGEPGWEIVTAVGDYGTVAAALREKGLPMAGELSGLRLEPLVRVDVVRDCTLTWHQASAYAHWACCCLTHASHACLTHLCCCHVMQADDEAFAANEALMDKLLELDDVDAVVSNQNDEEE